MKRTLMSFLAVAMMVMAPVSLTSCGDDETTQLINQIVNLLLGSSDELNNTQWLATDNSQLIEFTTNGNAQMNFLKIKDNQYVIDSVATFTYTIGGENNSTLTFTYADHVETQIITEYTAKKSITLVEQSQGTKKSYEYYTVQATTE